MKEKQIILFRLLW